MGLKREGEVSRERDTEKRLLTNLTIKRTLERKLKLEKHRNDEEMRKAQRERKQEDANFKRQRAHLLEEERKKNETYSKLLAVNKHLQSQERKMESMLKSNMRKRKRHSRRHGNLKLPRLRGLSDACMKR